MPNLKEDLKSKSSVIKEKFEKFGKKVEAGTSSAYEKTKAGTIKAADKVKDGVTDLTGSPSKDQASRTTRSLNTEISDRLNNIITSSRNLKEKANNVCTESQEKKDELIEDGAKKMEKMAIEAQRTCTLAGNEAKKLLKEWEEKSKARLAELEKELKNKDKDKEELKRLAKAWEDSTRSNVEAKLVELEASLAAIEKTISTTVEEAFGKK